MPGRVCAISPGKPSLSWRRPFPFPQGTILTFTLAQNHGGWNSGDNQNNNLGKFRLSITDTPNATADPLPKDVRDILSIPAAERTPLQVQTVFGYWRTTVPDWKAAKR